MKETMPASTGVKTQDKAISLTAFQLIGARPRAPVASAMPRSKAWFIDVGWPTQAAVWAVMLWASLAPRPMFKSNRRADPRDEQEDDRRAPEDGGVHGERRANDREAGEPGGDPRLPAGGRNRDQPSAVDRRKSRSVAATSRGN